MIALGMEPRLSSCQHSSSDIPMLRLLLVTGGAEFSRTIWRLKMSRLEAVESLGQRF
jgi:hypothetical protein